jgi:hypothetical protein
MIVRARKYLGERIAATIDWSAFVGTDTLTGGVSVLADASGTTVGNLSTTGNVTTFLLIDGPPAGSSPGIVTAEASTVGGKRRQVFIVLTTLPNPSE